MSEVISFRLNKDNPREKQALEILEKMRQDGFNTRSIITDAILGFYTAQIICEKTDENNLRLIMEQLIELIKNTRSQKMKESTTKDNLSDNFLNSIQESVKPGVKFNK